MRVPTVLVALAAATLAVAAWQQAVPELWINGAKANSGLLVQDGEVYVPLRALQAAGAEVSATEGRVNLGFSAPRAQANDVVAGPVGQFVSNGVWAARVQEIRSAESPFMPKGKGYSVVLELRNVTRDTQSPRGTGMQLQLIDSNGKVLTFGSRTFTNVGTRVAPNESVMDTVVFGDVVPAGATNAEADRLLIQFRANGAVKPRSIQVNLR